MSQPQEHATDQIPTSASSKLTLPRYDYASLTRVALVMNGLFAAAGYLFLSGHLRKLGIDIGELEIGLPALLFYGYLFLTNMIVESGFLTILVSSFILGLIATAMLAFDAAIKALGVKNLKEIPFKGQIKTGSIVCIFSVFALIIPACVYQQGEKYAVKNEVASMKLNAPLSDEIHVIPSDEGEIRGSLIIADQSFVYILAGSTVYKVDNNTQQIARRIEFASSTIDDEDKKDEG